jgi:heparan-alpha-glucosaminide N-acetyltransferase
MNDVKIFVSFLLSYLLCCSCVNAFEVLYSMSCDESINDVDHAKLYIKPIPQSAVTEYGNFSVYFVNGDCYKCSKTILSQFPTTTDLCFGVWTPFEYSLYLMSDKSNMEVSKKDFVFGELGQYNVYLTLQSSFNTIYIDEVEAPVNSFLPLEILITLLFLIAVFAFIGPYLYDKWKNRKVMKSLKTSDIYFNSLTITGDDEEEGMIGGDGKAQSETSLSHKNIGKTKKTKRLSSLDTFRGIALLLMIFVNYGGGGYWFFEHASWNGLTLAGNCSLVFVFFSHIMCFLLDLVFPWFMWIMGVSMALSFSNILPALPKQNRTLLVADDINYDYEKEMSSYKQKYYDLWKKVTIRSIKLFLLGLFLANAYDYRHFRVTQVLEYFAVSYFVTSATILLSYRPTQDLLDEIKRNEKTSYADLEIHPADDDAVILDWERFKKIINYREWSMILTAYRYEWLLQIMILIIYLGIHLGATAPGCPKGYAGAGGLSDDAASHCTGGIHRYIDLHVFGYDHIYPHPTCLDVYQCPRFDPEGVLGVLSACSLTYIGLMVGRVFLHYKNHQDRLVIINFWSFWLLLLAGILCGFSKDEGVIPVNKNLWSTSFILVCAGFGIIGLSICYIPIDVYHVWSGAPFLQLGMNSILFYMAHQLLQDHMPFSYAIDHYNHGSLLLCHVVGVVSWLLIAMYFYKIKFFVKV